MEPEERAALLADWQNREAAFAMLNWYRASPMEVPADGRALCTAGRTSSPSLPQLTIPTLVIWAMDDIALPPENLDGLEEWSPT